MVNEPQDYRLPYYPPYYHQPPRALERYGPIQPRRLPKGRPINVLLGSGGMLVGVFMLLTAIGQIIWGTLMLYIGSTIAIPFSLIGHRTTICLIYVLIISLFCIFSSYFAFKRQRFLIVLIGTILLIFTYGFISGIMCLIFLLIGRNEFYS